MNKKVLIEKIIPAIIFFYLWLDGWFYPLLLLPILYVYFAEKKDFKCLGFRKDEIKTSISMGLLVSAALIWTYIPIFLLYIICAKKLWLKDFRTITFIHSDWYYSELSCDIWRSAWNLRISILLWINLERYGHKNQR